MHDLDASVLDLHIQQGTRDHGELVSHLQTMHGYTYASNLSSHDALVFHNERHRPLDWLEHQFEHEFCVHCRGDAEDHDAIPFLGNWFARCKPEIALDDDDWRFLAELGIDVDEAWYRVLDSRDERLRRQILVKVIRAARLEPSRS